MTAPRGAEMFSKILADNNEGHRHPLGQMLLTVALTIGLAACDPVSDQPTSETVAASDVATPDFGEWSIYTKTDPLTDEKIIAIELASDQAQSTRGVTLSLYCSKRNAWAVVRWNEFLGGTKSADRELKPVTYRIGDGQPRIEEWPVLSDRTTSQIDGAPEFIMNVRDSEKLVLRVEPYQQNPLTAVFDTRGLKAALMANSPECDWYVRDIKWVEHQAKLKAEADKKTAPSQ